MKKSVNKENMEEYLAAMRRITEVGQVIYRPASNRYDIYIKVGKLSLISIVLLGVGFALGAALGLLL